MCCMTVAAFSLLGVRFVFPVSRSLLKIAGVLALFEPVSSVGVLPESCGAVGEIVSVVALFLAGLLAWSRAAGWFEAELHVALVGLLLVPFAGFLFVSARSVAVPQCDFRGPFEVKAVGKEKGKGTPTSCFWGFFRIQAWAAAFSRAIFCVEEHF